MGLPLMDIQMSKKPVAALITGVNDIKFLKIKKTMSGFFVDVEHGVFMLDPTKALRFDKQALYFYDVRSSRPLNILALKEIDEFIKKNGLERITQKDVNHAGRLRSLFKKHGKGEGAMEELKKEEETLSTKVHNEIDAINSELKERNEKLTKQNEPPMNIGPEDYSSYIIEALVSKGLVTRGEAASIKFNLVSGRITIDEFVTSLEKLHKVEVNHPITANAQHFIEEYRTFSPDKVLAYIKGAKGIGKDIKELGQPVIKNLLPLKYILVGLIGVAVFALVLSNVDLGALTGNLIPNNLFG